MTRHLTHRVTIIHPDGAIVDSQVNPDTVMDQIHEALGGRRMDTVNLRDGRTMWVIDDGWETEPIEHGPGHIELKPTKAKFPINHRATALYRAVCRPGTTYRITGIVAITYGEDEETP
jgi:hypothetical protein